MGKDKPKRKGLSIYPSEKASNFVINLKRMTGLKITRIMENALELYHEKIIEDQGLQIDTSKLWNTLKNQ